MQGGRFCPRWIGLEHLCGLCYTVKGAWRDIRQASTPQVQEHFKLLAAEQNAVLNVFNAVSDITTQQHYLETQKAA